MNEVVRRRRVGFQRERDLVVKLWKLGFACIRAPASGSKTKRTPYPDLVAIKDGRVFVMEVKTREKRETIYIPDTQIRKLLEFARRSGGVPLIAVKYMDGSGWKFIRVDYLERTQTGSWKITPELYDKGYTIEDLLAMSRPEQKLTRFLGVT